MSAEPAPESAEPLTVADPDDPFAGKTELALPELVASVQARNQSLQAALAAWAAAAERYPQEIAFDDPMLQTMFAPRSFTSSSNVQSSYYVGFAQKVPWAGKRELRGHIAQWSALAASLDYHDVQLGLAAAARIAFFDYYLVRRELELNGQNLDSLREIRDTAKARYEAAQVTQQDMLQAEVELARAEERQVELEQTDRITRGRVNTLLHRVPDHWLPAPAAKVTVPDDLPVLADLQQAAVAKRPDLAAISARLQAERNAAALACKEFYPDFEFMGRYDQFWTDREQRPQVGMNMNVPLNRAKRHAAVREAMFRAGKLQAEYNQQIDTVRQEVDAAHTRLSASRRMARLYSDRIVPAAQENIDSAVSGYTAGNVDFLRVVQAQRELIELLVKEQQTIVEYHRRLAELERAVGGEVGGGTKD